MIRRDGKLIQVPSAWQILEQDFGNGPEKVVSVGWGDVSTAYHSTGIPNIETYFVLSKIAISSMKFMRVIGPLMYNRLAKNILKTIINVFLEPGPNDEKRKAGLTTMIGEATDDQGNISISKLQTPEAYNCTALTTVEIMKRILNNDLKPGFQTVSLAYGADFILQFNGVQRKDLQV